MMKPAKAGKSDDLGGWLGLRLPSSHRGIILLQGQARSGVEVVRGEAGQKALQALLVEDGEPLSEREVFQDQVGPAGEDREESLGDGKSAVQHPRTMAALGTEGNRARPPVSRVSCIGTQLVEG